IHIGRKTLRCFVREELEMRERRDGTSERPVVVDENEAVARTHRCRCRKGAQRRNRVALRCGSRHHAEISWCSRHDVLAYWLYGTHHSSLGLCLTTTNFFLLTSHFSLLTSYFSLPTPPSSQAIIASASTPVSAIDSIVARAAACRAAAVGLNSGT